MQASTRLPACPSGLKGSAASSALRKQPTGRLRYSPTSVELDCHMTLTSHSRLTIAGRIEYASWYTPNSMFDSQLLCQAVELSSVKRAEVDDVMVAELFS